MDVSARSVRQLCGQLLVVGFEGEELPERLARALARSERAGVILFRRNLRELDQILALTDAVQAAVGGGLAPIVGVDQEGGRVTRLPAPALKLPPMRVVGALGDLALTEAAGEAVALELAALGFTLDFAPVLDVDSNRGNPVIGDRAFSADPALVADHGLAFARGLAAGGISACGKHFPGHGDTSQDSHLELARVDHGIERLRALELIPFAAACGAGIPALMSAHVIVTELDPSAPATLSPRIATELLRGELGFEGTLFSDDLEMGAIAATGDIGQAAVRAVRAGCDALLVCRHEALVEQAHEALVHEAERDGAFARRCREAGSRVRALRERAMASASRREGASLAAPTAERRSLARSVVGGERSARLRERIERARRDAGPALP